MPRRRKRSSTSPSLLPSSLPSSSSTSPAPSPAATMQQPQPQPRSNDNNQNSIKNSPTSSSTSPSTPPPSSTLPSTSSSARPPRPPNPQPHVSTAGVDTSALTSMLVKTDEMSPTPASQVMASSSMASTAGCAKEEAEVVVLLNQILQNIPPPIDIDYSSDEPSTLSRQGSSAIGPMSKKTALSERLQHPQQDDDDDHHRSPPLTSTSRPSSAAAAAGSEARNNSTAAGAAACGGGLLTASLQDQLAAISLDYAKYTLEEFRYPEADQIPSALGTLEFGILQMTGLLTKLKEINDDVAAETADKSKKKKKKKKKKPKEEEEKPKEEEEKPMEEDVDFKKEVEACQAQATVIFDLFHTAKEMVKGGDVQRETRQGEGTRHSSSTPLTGMESSDIGSDRDAESCSAASDDDEAADQGGF